MIWIKVDDIILIHSRIIKATGGVDGYSLSLKEGELSEMFISIAAGNSKAEDLLRWIQEHIDTL